MRTLTTEPLCQYSHGETKNVLIIAKVLEERYEYPVTH